MKRFAVTLAVLCCLLLPLIQYPAAAKETWTSVRSKNFFLIGNASEKEIRQVGVRLEQFREIFSRLFTQMNFNSPVPTTVIVFKNDSSYRPFKPRATTAGYFQSGPDVNYITLTTETRGEQDPFKVIFHEYTHLLVNNTVGNVPTWFNEGLAEYYSTCTISEDQEVTLGRPIASHVYLLRESKMLPLRTLFQVDQQSPYYNERAKLSVFYAESWALMHYLILGHDGQRVAQLNQFIGLLNANLPMEQAFQKAFQTSFENMEQELRAYIKSDRYPIYDWQLKDKLGVDTELPAAPVSDAEVQAYLGDLLMHSNRADAEDYLKKALALDPNLALANASMGMLLVRQGKIDEARRSLERAATANSQNYLIHYYYAYALSREGMDAAQTVTEYAPETARKIREELKKAIALRPDYPETYSLLAFVSVVNGDAVDESVDMLKQALEISPGRNNLAFMLAQLYLRKEDYKTGREILERLSGNNGDPQIRQQATSLLTQLASREEEIARFEALRKAAGANGSGPPRHTSSAGANEGNPVEPPDPSSDLQAALRTPLAGEEQIQGALVQIECDAKGITFIVKLDDRTLKLRTDSFAHVGIVAFTTEVSGEIRCGPRKPENTVVICYTPGTDARAQTDGTMKSLEFVPKDFKLKAQP
jgi:tetratricopeptide (TPR) repeat protein